MSFHRLVLLTALMAAFVGCSSMKRSDTARTAREQLLISNAVDQSLAKCDFAPFRGSKVFVEDKFIECVDKGYVTASIRHRLMMNGAVVAAKAEESDVVLELRSGGVGTDNSDSYVGIPAIVLPGMLTLPEVHFWEKSRQTALAKIGMVAYDSKNHEMLGSGGVSSSFADDSNAFFLGIGPFQNGTIRDEIRDTTTRQSSQPNQTIPAIVAFREVTNLPDPGRVQLTGEQREHR